MIQKTYITLDAVGVPAGSAVGKATVDVLHVQKPLKTDPKDTHAVDNVDSVG